MRFFPHRHRHSPIAIDLGGSSIKLLQLDDDGRTICAASQLSVPPDASRCPTSYLDWLEDVLPEFLENSGAKERRLLAALPSAWTTVQQLQLGAEEAAMAADIAAMHLPPLDEQPMTQVIEVGEVPGKGTGGERHTEFICFAFPKRHVFRIVELLHNCRYEILDLRTQFGASIAAFEETPRGEDDSSEATLYVDLGSEGVLGSITNEGRLVQARRIAAGMRNHDGDEVDRLDIIVDELGMALRHDASLFPNRRIERIIFLGGGAHSDHACRQIVERLHLPGQRGDPLAGLIRPIDPASPLTQGDGPRPNWSAAAGLLSRNTRKKEHLHAA